MAARKLTSLREAIDLVLGDTSEFAQNFSETGGGALPSVWFRGHSHAGWRPEPGVFRRATNGRYLFDEYNMLGEMRLIRPLEAGAYPTTFDWLVMCQHYGLPTRILDWSESILIALFFAAQDDHEDGALIALNPMLLNSMTSVSRSWNLCLPTFPDALLRAEQCVSASIDEVLDRMKSRFADKSHMAQYLENRGGEKRLREIANLPVAVYPPRNNARIVQQSGMFTLHGGTVPSTSHISDFGEPVSFEEINAPRGLLAEFIIPAKSKRVIRSELARFSIHYGTLFPEFESQARYLRDKWTLVPRHAGDAPITSASSHPDLE